jgi:hypothetical protein
VLNEGIPKVVKKVEILREILKSGSLETEYVVSLVTEA